MAGWTDSGGSRGRGGGGGGFANRGGANGNNMNTRWRERRPQPPQPQPQQHHQQQQQQHHQQQQQHDHQQHQQQHHQQHQQQHHQQQHRYRPVNDNDRSSQQSRHSPAEELDRQQVQGGSSTSARRPRPTRPPQARPTFTDHKLSPTSTPNANEPDDKARRNAANFECNVCFDMADDPVVTKCGHLFCWECLYQWLHVHSNHRECPVCKGQVADDAIIPIYGRGGSAASVQAAPPRPTGARVESSRQQQLQQASAANWTMLGDHEDDDPFDLQEIRLGFGIHRLRDAVLSFIPDDHVDIEQDYDDYTDPYLHHSFDEVYGSDFTRLPIFRSADAAEAAIGSSRRHGHHSVFSDDIMDTFFDNTTHQEPDFGYRGGRRQRGRARGMTSADHFNDHMVDMVLESSLRIEDSSGASYRDTSAGPHHHSNNTGGSSRPNGGWTERRGRSNRNSNSGGGRGTQNSRRQGANYN
ncbi:uncharacterized protein LOC123437098 [Hordeum vulgare subsp. vulgare]|uniref:E3 ubiquitin-protein ligase RMA n=1 Tax=Hordeum vulgare subsp. vulgare TaxID=112509 RepID=A0A287FJK5_HORVV|nr:uncharacterized protein LOC123437098 [Hordeum vulgare subsp. vulgare]